MNKTEEEKNIWNQMEQLQTQLEEVMEDDKKCKQVQKKIEKATFVKNKTREAGIPGIKS